MSLSPVLDNVLLLYGFTEVLDCSIIKAARSEMIGPWVLKVKGNWLQG